MTTNIMQQYIKITKNFIKTFTKMFLAEKYNEKISNEYIKTYIEARIYNFGEEKQRFFYRRIYETLMNKKEELIENLDKKNKEKFTQILDANLKLYQYIFYADGVRKYADLEEFSKTICEEREKKFNVEPIKKLENKVYKIIKQYNEEKELFLKSFDTKDFSLDIQKYILINNTYKVNLNYNFKLPYIYSNKIIDEVYNEGTINEDKLIIEYILLVPICIKDIMNSDFDTKYLVDFANTLYKKEKKIKQTLRVIDDLAIQDKIILKVTYTDFIENKDLIYSLMQDGFKFAIIIDDNFSVTDANLRKLNVFSYMLVPRKSKNYEKIKDKETKINNIVIYDL